MPGRPRSVCALVLVASAPQRRNCRRGGDRSRNGGVPVGRRTRGHASVRATLFFPPLAEPGVVEHERWGTPVLSYVAGFAPDARPLDRGKPRDEDTEGGSQPADKSLINRRLFGSQCLLLPTAVSPQPALNRAFSLDREHKRLDVSSQTLMAHSYRVIRRMRYGTDSTRERHNDRGGPSSDTT